MGGFSKYEETLTFIDLDSKDLKYVTIEAFKRLGWHIGPVTNTHLIAYISNPLSSSREEIIVDLNGVDATISSSCTDNQYDDLDKNKTNVKSLIETYNSFLENITTNDLEHYRLEGQKLFVQTQIHESNNSDGINDLLSFRAGYFATPLFIYINVFIFGIMILSGVDFISPTTQDLIAWGANFAPLTLNGDLWRLFTGCFLHIGIIHLLSNLYALAYVGLRLEPLLGNKKFILAYLITGIVGSICSVFIHDKTVCAGASGAIFGMYGLFLAMLSTDLIENKYRKVLLINIVLLVTLNLINGMKPGIDNAAHIGGLVSGIILGFIFYPMDISSKSKTTDYCCSNCGASVVVGQKKCNRCGEQFENE